MCNKALTIFPSQITGIWKTTLMDDGLLKIKDIKDIEFSSKVTQC